MGMMQLGNIARTYAESLVSNGYKLVVVPDTEIALLMGSDLDRERAEGQISQLGDLVKAHISTVKNVINPCVLEVKEKLDTLKKNLSNPDIEESFDIIPVSIPEPILDPSFMSDCEEFSKSTPVRPNMNFSGVMLDVSNGVSYLVTNGGKFGLALGKWISTEGEYFVIDIIQSYFNSSSVDSRRSYLQSIENASDYDKLNRCLAMYTVLNYLDTNTPNTDASLKTFEKMINEHKVYCYAMISNATDRIHSSMSIKTMVLEYNGTNVVVDAVVYDDWLKTGGKPEVLLGAMLCNDKVYTSTELSENSRSYLDKYENYCAMRNMRTENDVYEGLLKIAPIVYEESFLQPTEVDKAYTSKNPSSFDEGRKILLRSLSRMSKNEVMDTHELAKVIIAKSRFYYTPAFQILNDIDAIGLKMTRPDAREASLYAAIRYVVEYCLTMAKLQKVS